MDNKRKYISLKSIYLYMQQHGGAIKSCDYLTHLELMHKSILGDTKDDRFKQYESLKKTRLQCTDGKILFMYSDKDTPKYKPILWATLKEYFKNSSHGISISVMKGIGALRKMTIDHLLKRDLEESKKDPFDIRCYTEIGSTDATSDLDFTYVQFNNPSTVVDLMINFYNEFHKVFGNFPDDTFDTNYYVSSAFVSTKCFAQITGPIKELFVDYGHAKNEYRRYYFKSTDSKYQNLDRNICFAVQSHYLKSLDSSHHSNKVKHLIQASVIYYNLLSIYNTKLDNDKFMILTRALYYLMTSNSNESYISDTTFNIIVLGQKMPDLLDNLLAYVDNYIFIHEWFLIYKNKKTEDEDPYEGFFDVISKYIVRCNNTLKGSDFKLDAKLVECSSYWREHIRGKIPLASIMTLDYDEEFTFTNDRILDGGNIMAYIKNEYPTIEDIHSVFESLYDDISKKFSITSQITVLRSYINSLLKRIVVTVKDGNISYDHRISEFNTVIKEFNDMLDKE